MKSYALPAVLLLVAVSATACTATANVDAAPDAANPDCAAVMVALPDEMAGYRLRDTASQSTAAWGDPSKAILRCGVPVPGPTTDPCAEVNGVDWVLRENEDTWTATTYGREPAVEVVFNPNEVASSTILVQLQNAVSKIEPTSQCLSPEDTLELDG
ncbi:MULTISPECIES: DUF3515 domain-containing protein [unclassified Arthrobacter]|uniref:DUF3515 domain-containing protein n=1 Tax=unclassified Arthrobacter TaxID=235627 RepID=UPI001D13F044|nr:MULTISPECIES: DUF3515 domain-containing protein [unclassified Arthrobacter]MCC3275111.1 DUF3515 domain-containing protein [Arthrobacter sp. zg-Y20]MCC3278915.1 DUF3515 domain-containing protein [Arthrobacter sp. zg-Y40]MCC9177292.1 DUF3515 domain-containing protein [Arthrobacter sp. zg-Y750]MDK1315268.1 DUF3515 domain-containing protein [Arthrobacter sp. zg.Y20]MDK1329057.1 DUF3515 domain-containing protein [Arthrobacter sp. zg-Y1143]